MAHVDVIKHEEYINQISFHTFAWCLLLSTRRYQCIGYRNHIVHVHLMVDFYFPCASSKVGDRSTSFGTTIQSTFTFTSLWCRSEGKKTNYKSLQRSSIEIINVWSPLLVGPTIMFMCASSKYVTFLHKYKLSYSLHKENASTCCMPISSWKIACTTLFHITWA